MTSLLDLYKKIKRQYINLSLIRAASLKDYLFHLPSFLFGYFSRSGEAPFPLNITLDLSYHCNLKCPFCFLYDQGRPGDADEGEDLLSYEEIERLLVSLKGKTTTFFLTGGEPTLRKDFSDIVGLIKAYPFRCGAVTNGTVLTESLSTALIDHRLDYLFFSLDGPEAVHDALRGKGAFRKTCENIKYLSKTRKDRTPRIIMGATLLPGNQEKLRDLIDIADDLGIDGIALSFLSFLTDKEYAAHKTSFAEFFPDEEFRSSVYVQKFADCDPEKLPALIKEARRYADKKDVPMFLKPDLKESELKMWFKQEFRLARTCIYPWNVLRISPKGDVYPCAQFHIKMGNIRQAPLGEIWNNRKFRDFRNYLKAQKTPAGCNRCCKL